MQEVMIAPVLNLSSPRLSLLLPPSYPLPPSPTSSSSLLLSPHYYHRMDGYRLLPRPLLL